MKVFAISDLHLSLNNPKPMDIFGGNWDNYVEKIVESWRASVGDDDVILIGGDISWAMNLDSAVLDINFIGELPGKKIIIRGNHDYWWKSISAVRGILPHGFYALQNDCIRIGEYLFCGSRGWSYEAETAEDKKIYDREIIRMGLSLKNMQGLRQEGDKVVVITHYPPFNVRIEPSPMTELFSNHKVDKVIYGHLHGKGVRIIPRAMLGGVEYILTSCDLIGNRLVEV